MQPQMLRAACSAKARSCFSDSKKHEGVERVANRDEHLLATTNNERLRSI